MKPILEMFVLLFVNFTLRTAYHLHHVYFSLAHSHLISVRRTLWTWYPWLWWCKAFVIIKVRLKPCCLEQVLLIDIVLSGQQQFFIIPFIFLALITLITFTHLTFIPILIPTLFPPIKQKILFFCIRIIFPLKWEVYDIYRDSPWLHLKIILSSNSGYKILNFLFIFFIYILNCLYFFCLLIDLLQ